MNHIRIVFVHPLSQLLTLLTWTLVMVSDFYRLRVWFRHLVLFGCSSPAPSQSRSQAPEYAKWPKMAYSARIMPQSYILLLRPYYARNFAGRLCTTQCPQPGLEPRPLNPESSAPTMMPSSYDTLKCTTNRFGPNKKVKKITGAISLASLFI